MDPDARRFSGSDHLLGIALEAARGAGAETQMIRLDDLQFRACRGYYSKAAGACTWPCSITQMHADDELTVVYEALVHWADAIIVATPIRWGAASSLYFRMAERLNCIQNAITTKDRVLIKNKVAGFIIVGGQDNVQSVAGQMIGFFAELGFLFPQFPYIAHSRGWSHEDMENNVAHVRDSPELAEGANCSRRKERPTASRAAAGRRTQRREPPRRLRRRLAERRLLAERSPCGADESSCPWRKQLRRRRHSRHQGAMISGT
jgi:multimeric flavodoxin WrbA